MAAIDLCISPINLLDAVEGARAGLNHVRGLPSGIFTRLQYANSDYAKQVC